MLFVLSMVPFTPWVTMILSLVGTLVFAGVAVWLWPRQTGAPRRSPAPPTPTLGSDPRLDSTPPPDPVPTTTLESGALPGPIPTAPVPNPDPNPDLWPAGADAEPEDRTAYVAPFGFDPLAPPTLAVQPPSLQPHSLQPHSLQPPSLAVQPASAHERAAFVPSLAPRDPVGFSPVVAPEITPSADPNLMLEPAVAAFIALERGDAGQAPALADAIATLVATPIDALLSALRPLLAGPEPGLVHTSVAWLALFHHPSCIDARVVPNLLGELGELARRTGLRSLASWTDPRAELLARAGLERCPEGLRGEWLALLAERGWSPDDEVLDAALAASDATILIPALRLAASRPPEQVKSRVSPHVFRSAPAVRLAAIETALVFRDAAAWMSCRQLARSPSHPGATELVALLGSAADLAKAVGGRAAADEGLLWAVGLAGRPAALADWVAELEPDASCSDSARSAFELATGVVFGSSAQAQAWLLTASDSSDASNSTATSRMLGGVPRTLSTVSRHLATSESLALRQAIARELRIRTAGQVILSPDVFAHRWREQLEGLAELELDLDLEFPWSA